MGFSCPVTKGQPERIPFIVLGKKDNRTEVLYSLSRDKETTGQAQNLVTK
jgi:hypothetical protein